MGGRGLGASGSERRRTSGVGKIAGNSRSKRRAGCRGHGSSERPAGKSRGLPTAVAHHTVDTHWRGEEESCGEPVALVEGGKAAFEVQIVDELYVVPPGPLKLEASSMDLAKA